MSGLNLTLQAGTAPYQQPLPGNAQALLNFIAAYIMIAGGQNFNGINFGASTPAPANRGLPWFKTDQFRNPLGFFSWNGTIWSGIPIVLANGPTTSRPPNPGVGTEYYDTTIGALLVFSASGWTTASGSVGDVKEVQAADIATALANNPGWVQDTQSTGLVVGAAGDATGITVAHPYGQIIGEEAHTLLLNEMPAHTHPFTGYLNGASANGNTGPGGILSDHNTTATQSAGGNAPHNNLPPMIFYWRLLKKF
jgi:microcystin-dependent protein